jgi:hypothetical protein
LTILSQEVINPVSSPAKVYGIIDVAQKTEGLNTVRSSSSNKEKEFLEHQD